MLDVMTNTLTSCAPYAGCDAVQGIFYAENLGPAVLQCFSHFDQNAEKAADFCFSHEISPFQLCLLPLL